MGVKKVIQDSFEQIAETGKDMAKSSAKQVIETLSPWEMIRNSFSDSDAKSSGAKMKETPGKADKHTPLDLSKLEKSYENQDQKKIESMKQRLFQLVKRDEERTLMSEKQKKRHDEQAQIREEAERKRKVEEQRRRMSMSDAPEGKSGRGTALIGRKKKRMASEPQPAETKPGGGKQ